MERTSQSAGRTRTDERVYAWIDRVATGARVLALALVAVLAVLLSAISL